LALESIIGTVVEDEGEDGQEVVKQVVEEGYLEMLAQLANERFAANTERIERFRAELLRSQGRDGGKVWGDKEARRARKRAEGLEKQAMAKKVNGSDVESSDEVIDALDNQIFDAESST
jgi:tRNA wybutosine-synthesizing protein 3